MFNPFLPFFLIINRTPRYWIPLPSLPVCFLPGYPPLSCRIFFFFSEDIAIASRIFSFDSRRIHFSQIASPFVPILQLTRIITWNLLKLYIFLFRYYLYLINYQRWKINDGEKYHFTVRCIHDIGGRIGDGLRIEYNRYSICWKVTWLQKKNMDILFFVIELFLLKSYI